MQIIKENGGPVIAQARPTSEKFSMPETSIKTGDVDYILPLDEIAPMLIALVWTSRPANKTSSLYAAGTKAVMLKRRK